MKRHLGVFLLFVFTLLLQQSPIFPFHYGGIDLLIPFILLLGLWRGSNEGVLYGFLAGFLEGTCAGYAMGTFIFTRTLLGWGGGMLKGIVVREHPLTVSLLTFWGTLVCDLLFLFLYPHPFTYLGLRLLLIKALVNALFAPLFNKFFIYLFLPFLELERTSR